MSEMTVAASEAAFRELFGQLRDGFSFADSDSIDLGTFSAGYSVAAHLEGGTVDLRGDNTVRVAELDIKWDTLSVWFGINFEERCFGGWCVIPTPWGCAVRLPKICVFSADPDLVIPLNLSGLLTSEVSFIGSLLTKYFVDPGRASWMDDLDAQDAGVPNMWQIFIDPESVDIDVFDVADIVGDLLEDAIDFAVDTILAPLPGWAKDLIKAILGPLVDLVRAILDLPDDITEWIADLLDTTFGLLNTVATAILDYLASETPIVEFEDPYPFLPASSGLIPVKVPIENLQVEVTDDEMIVSADVGG